MYSQRLACGGRLWTLAWMIDGNGRRSRFLTPELDTLSSDPVLMLCCDVHGNGVHHPWIYGHVFERAQGYVVALYSEPAIAIRARERLWRAKTGSTHIHQTGG